MSNHIKSEWNIPGGKVELMIATDEALPKQVWPEVAVLMQLAQDFSRRAMQLSSVEELNGQQLGWPIVEDDEHPTTILQVTAP